MRDHYGREIDYLRMSVTDLCNERCVYCMPQAGVAKRTHDEMLTIEELARIAEAAVACGICKIRLTGGEPLVRRGTVELCRQIGRLSGLKELCITTNGLLLPELAGELLAAGVSHINVSLDSLRAERYAAITRRGTLAAALRGLDCALNAGFAVVKLNMVLIGGVNDDELGDFIALTEHNPIEVRFLELMPMGECANWPNERFISADTVLERFPALAPLTGCGVAERYRMPGYAGTVGLIRPMSNRFCDTCSRVRITADGMLKPCLHSGMELSLRGLHGETLVRALREGILQKPEHHVLMDAGSAAGRRMNEIGG